MKPAFRILRPALQALILATGLAGCATSEAPFPPSGARLSSELALRLTMEKTTVAPGEPLIVRAALKNLDDEPRQVPQLSHESLEFRVFRRSQEGPGPDRATDPVYSEQEPPANLQFLLPGEAVERAFVFTTLSLEKGRFRLTAETFAPSPPPSTGESRVVATAADFEVAGDEVFAQRYLNGLITKEKAIEIAAEASSVSPEGAEAKLIIDEAGFHKWWVNLDVDSTRSDAARSWFIDPYLARVWREAEPFDPLMWEDEVPENSRLLRDIQEKRRRQKLNSPAANDR